MTSSSREIVTVGIGSFGVLAATQWANGLSQFEVDQCSCTFDELRRPTGAARSNKAVRAVFLDQHYRSGIRAEMSVEDTDAQLNTLNINPKVDVLDIFGGNSQNNNNDDNNNQQASASAAAVVAAKKTGGKNNHRHHRDPNWPRHSAKNMWARQQSYDDDEEEEEESDGDDEVTEQNQRTMKKSDGADSSDDDNDNNDADCVDTVRRTIASKVRKAPEAMPHHPWWQYLTAPHRGDLDRVVSFIDLPGVTDTGGWSQLRSFGFGLHNSAVHSQLERDGSFNDNLRKELEACDQLDAVQLFVDSDSSFGGIATHVASHVLNDELGVKSSFAISCLPDPGDDEVSSLASQLARRSRELAESGSMLPPNLDLLFEDHRNLNRGLATSLLSQACRGYVPHEIHSWGPIFSAYEQNVLPGLNTTDDVAAASVVANWTDSVFLPCRSGVSSVSGGGGGGGAGSSSDIVAVSGGAHGVGASNQFIGGNLAMAQLMDMLRPSPSLRVSAAYLALPFLKSDPANVVGVAGNEGGAAAGGDAREPPRNHNSSNSDDKSLKALLFNVLDSSSPLLSMQRGNFRPLSGVVVDPDQTSTDAHTVISHSYCLRAGLPFADDRAAIREAMVQFSMGIRCGAYTGYAIREPCPLSGTFPKRIFASSSAQHHGGSKKEGKEQKEEGKLPENIEKLRTVSCGAHILTTNSAGQYLHSVREGALRKSMNLRGEQAKEAMSVDGDSWRELEEDLAALRDSYHYEPEDLGGAGDSDLDN